jgi:uncharacterized protein
MSIERPVHPPAAPGRPAGIEELTEAECRTLLASQTVGRLAVRLADDSILVAPVNYVVDDGAVVFRTDEGTKLEAASHHLVSFQTDAVDPYHRTGWSVLVQGCVAEAPPAEVEHLVLVSWATGDKPHWMRIVPRRITGRRLRPAEAELDLRGYL